MHSHLHGHPSIVEAVKRLESASVDQYELYFTRKRQTKIDCKNQEVDSLSRSEDVGLAVRIIKDQRMGFSFTTSLETDSVGRAIESAVAIAGLMPEDEFNTLHSFGSSVYPEVDQLDRKGLEIPLDIKIALAKKLERETRQADPRITAVRSASVNEVFYESHLVDSHGEQLRHEGSLFAASVTCKAEQDGDNQLGSEFNFNNYFEQLDVSGIAQLAAIQATELLGAKGAPTMKCPAVIRNSVVTELLDFLSASFSAEEIDKGRSMLAGKEGERIFAEPVTLIDDGLLAGGYATSPFDGEGIPSGRTTLVDGGFLKAALYDSYYGLKMKKAPTGNASRGIKSPPSIGVTNLFLQPGKKSFKDLFKGMSKGILITDLMGIHTANPITGDFSLGASGILVENGELTRPVRGFAVAGNILELFRLVTDVGSDQRFFGNVGAPSLRISELSVGGT